MPPDMKIEYKSRPVLTKQINDRTVTGIFAVHGNIDEGGDRSHPGAFADVTINGRNRVRFLWQHSPWDPPIAKIDYVRELTQAELPPQVLNFASDATGAVEVSRTYLNTPRGNEVLEALKADAIDEMSYGYEVAQADFEELDGREIRNLRKLELYDISDVLWGMNPATVGSKNWPWPVPLDFLRDPAADESALLDGMRFAEHSRLALAAAKELGARARNIYELRAKEGRVLSSANRKRIQALVKSLRAVTADLEQLLDETDPEKAAKEARRLYAEFLHIESEILNTAV